ncbi:agamous-like MADS-box protein AGL30 isoform X1 [Arabidopsis lyrata subsp. lyrata]|uniref:agamous-like MADS-box protein AGL30 isoform X1 n=1 Tax=Arabidopsis lyrata subsp. lyrata TaxID=81972 RepID=UPI000A29C486|nr:agamous-like MADS-box protein AGL30 isoform X1 [Arabidopsis lyrata subsp. lyrata]XP_020880221.1 agamous-like MADS-box protein AGL30 isoform X1 [Arabidopsis lyrata subsp. lyrata]|eukprot:XP_020880220.1 agamous-like MADS-box protein AGL30 isoform X1 [Arabidopsis lyrata subsp. lyrata]
MGRVKLKIKKLENTTGRQSTFAKRKNGILKKANELSILCDIDIVLLMFSPTGKAAICCGTRSSMEEVIAKFSQVSPQERTKRFGVFRILIDMFLFVPALFGLVFYSLVALFFENRKFESLENLKKTFQKLDHDVNIREFIASSNSTIEDLSNQARILQARISEIHGRLSYWTEPDKINNVEHLGQLEISIRQSLDQLRAHKEHFGQQQHAMQIENANFVKDWSTCSMQDGIQIPLEQQLQSMSWILNSNTTNIVTEEHNSIPQREVECSASSSFGSYPGYYGTGKSPEITISGQETSFLDELNTGQLKPQTSSQQQFINNNITAYNPNLQNDLNHHQTLPPPIPPPQVYIPMAQREYHMNGFFEGPPPGLSAYNNNTNQTRFGGSSSNSLPCSISMFDEYLFSQMQQPN